jgi:multiple sugar transport system permease protein
MPTAKHRKESPLPFILPSVLLLIIITIAPMAYSLGGSLLSWSIIHTERPLQLANNYGSILLDPFFWSNTMAITAFYMVVVIVEFALGFFLAMVASRELRGMSVFKVSLIVPIFMMPVAASLLWKYMFNPSIGILNWVLALVGFAEQKWVSDPSTALTSIMMVDIWQWTPFMFMLLLAGVQAVPRESTEAAMVDGASYLRIIRRIALPYMKPVMLVAVLIRAMDAFREFDKIKVLTDGGPGSVTSNLVFQAFLQAFRYFEMGYSMALSWIAALIIIAMTMILTRQLQK